MSTKKAEARERVKAMREEQARKERRREQTLRFGIVGAVLAAAVIIGIAVVSTRDSGPEGPALDPAGVTEAAGGVPAHEISAEVPTVEVWFDFSCPHCAEFEAVNGEFLDQLAAAGEANLVYRPVTVIGSTASVRATNAWACALDEEIGAEFMDAAYAQQGAYRNSELLDAGESVGLDSGEFSDCVSDGTYDAWVNASNEAGTTEFGVTSTPTIFVQDGDERTLVEPEMWNPEGLQTMVAAASEEQAGDEDAADDEAEGAEGDSAEGDSEDEQ